MKSQVKLRRAGTICAYWDGGELTFTNWRTGDTMAAGAAVTGLLDYFGQWRSRRQAVKHMKDFSEEALLACIENLLKMEMLVVQGSRIAELDETTRRAWACWHPAGIFHFGTRNVPFVPEGEMEEVLREFLKHSPQPPAFKLHRGSRRFSLPVPKNLDGGFTEVLMRRQTHREFSGSPVDLTDLSTLLHSTFGVAGVVRSPALGNLIHKTSPSGGARHPIEAYVVALNVSGVPKGLYHYAPRTHELELLKRKDLRNEVSGWCADQAFVNGAAFLVFMTAMLPRVRWKYRFGRAYRIVLLDAGHLGQTFCLTASALGLGPFCTAALKDTQVEEALGLDGIEEVALYVTGAGHIRDAEA